MEKFTNLYNFIDFAQANRKYPANTANNLKSAVKIFEKELNAEELKSIAMVEESIAEIFRSLVIAHKDKSIVSLNTYKARLLKVIKDYKKYGAEPSKMQYWLPRPRQSFGGQGKTRKSTPLLIKNDKTDKEKIRLSNFITTPVDNLHKIEFALRDNAKSIIIVPRDITEKEVKIIKGILDSLIAE